MENIQPCPICGKKSKWIYESDKQQIISYECSVCGKFKTLEIFLVPKAYKPEKHYILSAIVRELNEFNLPEIIFTMENIEGYLSESQLPSSLAEKFNKILLYIYHHTKVYGKFVGINVDLDYPIAFAVDSVEFNDMLDALVERRLIAKLTAIEPDNDLTDQLFNSNSLFSVSLTTEGWDAVDKLRAKNPVIGNQCFVAMSFAPTMNEAWEKGIKLGIEDTGYKPLRVDKEEHNDQITDRIIADIRQSRIMVADFTGQNQGVYYEAGFARGLNKTVISCCHEDDLKNLHFDTKPINHIVWKDAADLREKLKNRILATVPLK